jgi:hypothetical protein
MTAEPQLPGLPSTTLVQVAVTADAGTVEQLANDEEAACTVKVQVAPGDPPDVVQLIVAAALPETAPESGSVAVKLIVLGVAETALIVVPPPPLGKMLFGTMTLGFF